MNNQEIHLSLTVDEVNTLLTSLGNMPYSQVYQLILKIQSQAQQQLENSQVAHTNGAESTVED